MRMFKHLLCASALMLVICLLGCTPDIAEDPSEDTTKEITSEEESTTAKEDITVEYEAETIEIQEKFDSSNSIKIEGSAVDVIIELLNESDKWVHKTSHASYNYVFILSDESSVEYCSVHGIFKDKTVGKELRLTENEIDMIKRSIPLDPISKNYSEISESIEVGKTYYDIYKIIGDRGIETDEDELIYRWVFEDGTVLYIDFEEPDLTAFDYPDDLIASEIKTEKIS